MRPEKLIMSAFGSYAGKVEIDFAAHKNGLFLITGDTGAGKTTIFDAITYALYNQTSGGERNGNMMRSQYALAEAETYVEFSFAYAGETYCIRRNPDYKIRKQLKNKTVKEQKVPSKVELFLPDGAVFLGKKSETDAKIVEIIGLTAEQFTQIIMIAQGDFRKLLYAKSDERKQIFSKLFHTQSFLQIQENLQQRSGSMDERLLENERAMEQEQSRMIFPREELKELPFEDAVETIKEWEKEITQTLEKKRIEADEHRNAVTKAEQINQLYAELEEQKRQKMQLEEEKSAEQMRQKRILEAQKAEKVFWVEEKKLEKESALSQSIQSIDMLEKRILETGIKYQEKEMLLKEQAKQNKERENQISKELLLIENSLCEYDKLHQAKLLEQQEKETYEFLWQQFCLKITEQKRELQALSEQIEKQEEELKRIFEQWEKNTKEAKRASAYYEIAYRAFLAEQAGILAEHLKEGEPCPVCGSCTHPDRAQLSEAAVSEDEVKKAKTDREAAEQSRETSFNRFSALKAEIAEAKIRLEQEEKNYAMQVLGIEDKIYETALSQKYKEKTDGEMPDRNKIEMLYRNWQDRVKETKEILFRLPYAKKEEALAVMEKKKEQIRKQQEAYEAECLENQKRKQEWNTAQGQKLQEEKKKQQLETEIKGAAEAFDAELKAAGFAFVDAYRQAHLSEDEWKNLERISKEYQERCIENQGRLEILKKATAGKKVINTSARKEKIAALEKERKELEQERLRMHTAYVTDVSVLEKSRKYLEQKTQLEKENQIIKSLYRTANGKLTGSAKIDFETYIQRQYFKQIIHEANKRLLTMSNHQFILKLKEEVNAGRKSNEGLDLSVHSLVTNSERDIKTLSGGEAFLAALAMALGLSDIAMRKAGAVHLDMMFIDEGFGSLDTQSRKQAIGVLDQLAGDNRLVGIISHVTELKEQIDHRLLITRDDKGSKAIWEVE